jgi:hypothetical protein
VIRLNLVRTIYSFFNKSLNHLIDDEKVPKRYDTESTIKLPIYEDEDGCDGGYGWLVVLGAFFVQLTCFGIFTSWGKVYFQSICASLFYACTQKKKNQLCLKKNNPIYHFFFIFIDFFLKNEK